MNKPQFTQGPWSKARFTDSSFNDGFIIMGDGLEVCRTKAVNAGELHATEARPNAHLIASAPDMYEALSSLLDDMPPESWESLNAPLQAAILQALAKARGES